MFYPDLKLVVLGTTETLNTLGGASKTFIAPGCKTVKKKSRSPRQCGTDSEKLGENQIFFGHEKDPSEDFYAAARLSDHHQYNPRWR